MKRVTRALMVAMSLLAHGAPAQAHPEDVAREQREHSHDDRQDDATQHDASRHPRGEETPGTDHASDEHSAARGMHQRMMHAMTGPLGIPLQQNASGTGWQPRSTPMYGHMTLLGDWALMLHYLVFAGVDAQGSRRGATEAVTTHWVMGMAQRPVLGGQFTARTMLSLEPLFLGSDGYALLLQTGETSGGEPLVDRQHPHDLFMEVAVRYSRALTDDLAFEIYAAPAGEPAIGPTAFPHRASAYADPLAPLSHHWQDSTHILFGVLTAGLYTEAFKLEGSWFNGREPDEGRYDFDLRVPDSYSVRLSLNPNDDWSGQVSYGFLREPEFLLEPGEDVRRATGSIVHNRRLGNGNWTSSLVWGQNRGEHGEPTNALLLESSLLFGLNDVFGRVELIQKSGHDFALEGPAEEETFMVAALSFGYVRNLGPWAGMLPGIGVRGAINFVPGGLTELYGTRYPLGAMVFVRLRPTEMMGGMQH